MEMLKIVLQSLSENTVTLELTRMSVDDRPIVRHLPGDIFVGGEG